MSAISTRALAVLGTLALLGGAAVTATQAQHAHGPAPAPRADASRSTQAYQAAMATMHRDMAIPYTGNADRDFAAGMIPHHQGAIAMAEVVLQHGADPQTRALAETIIRDQTREIAQLRAILARLPAR